MYFRCADSFTVFRSATPPVCLYPGRTLRRKTPVGGVQRREKEGNSGTEEIPKHEKGKNKDHPEISVPLFRSISQGSAYNSVHSVGV